MTDVAVVGTGRMGAAMAARIAGAGHRVTLFNRTPERAAALADRIGVAVAATAREAAAGAEVVVTSLADDAALRHVYGGSDGLVAGLEAGAVVADTSTVHPETARAVAAQVAAAGADMLDAPVSGSVPLVERGELTVLAGGSSAALEKARPVLSTFASRIFHLGGQGAGATMKLAVNSVIHALNLALSEALVLAERSGVDRELAYEVFAASAIAAPFVHYKRDAFLKPDEATVAFALDLVGKDLDLINELAAAVGARMEQLATNRAIVAEALAAGHGGRDMSAIAALLRG